MTTSIQLPPDLAERLDSEAARRGVSIEEWIRDALDKGSSPTPHRQLPTRASSEDAPLPMHERQARLRAFEEFLKETEDIDAPNIPDEALRRENLYEDRHL